MFLHYSGRHLMFLYPTLYSSVFVWEKKHFYILTQFVAPAAPLSLLSVIPYPLH